MVRGNIIFQGTNTEALDFFKNMGHICPDTSNPADFFINVLEDKDENNLGKQKKIVAKFQNGYINDILPKVEEGWKKVSDSKINFSLAFKASWFIQFGIIYKRSYRNFIRCKDLFW